MHQNTARPRLLDQVRDRIRFKHYSLRTGQAYVDWIKRFIRFHGNRHPSDLSGSHLEAFLTHLAIDSQVAASTQNQALHALLFLYRHVLRTPMVVAVMEVCRLAVRSTSHTPLRAAFRMPPGRNTSGACSRRAPRCDAPSNPGTYIR